MPYPASNLYEAMYMYALSVNMTSSEGNDSSNGRLIATRLWGNSFTSKIYTYNLFFFPIIITIIVDLILRLSIAE